MPKKQTKINSSRQRMIDGDIQKLPRKANSADKVQVTIRMHKKTRKFIREFSKKHNLSQGDALDKMVNVLKESIFNS